MQIGVIAEGPADVAVLTNVLKGALGLDSDDVIALRPDLQHDETDAHTQAQARFSNFQTVIAECQAPHRIADFLSAVDEPRWVVLHLDAAEAHLLTFDSEVLAAAPEPTVQALRQRCVLQVARWLGPRLFLSVRCAIAVHEMDAWVLPLYDERLRDTAAPRSAKEHLQRALQRSAVDEGAFGRTAYARRLKLSKELSRRKGLLACAARNFSLQLFLDELSTLPHPDVS